MCLFIPPRLTPPLQKTLTDAIDHLLNCTARWTPRWFNKPKFHILRHLPQHICRFGPAMLFATEAFESFNAVIRIRSVHSNRQAPSRDIARSFARANRTRHLISGGVFLRPGLEGITPSRVAGDWVAAGDMAQELLRPMIKGHVVAEAFGLIFDRPSAVLGTITATISLLDV